MVRLTIKKTFQCEKNKFKKIIKHTMIREGKNKCTEEFFE